jgi:hypothetical protein
MIPNRKLGFLEAFCIHQNNQRNGSGSIACITHIDGVIDFNTLKQALLSLFERHPMLRSTVHIENEQYVFKFTAKFEDILISQLHSTDQDVIHKVYTDDAVQKFDCTKSLWRVFLISHNPKKHDLIIGYSHAMCDGISIVNISSEILYILMDLKTDKKNRYEALSCPSALEAQISSKVTNKQLVNDEIVPREVTNPNCFNNKYDTSLNIVPCCHIQSIPEIKFKKIIDACKKNKTTVNALLNVAFANALMQHRALNEKSIDIINAANARPLTDSLLQSENMGNYVIAAPTIIPQINNETNVWKSCRQFNINLRENLKNFDAPDEPNIADLDNLLSLIDTMLNEQTTLIKYGVSNIGSVDEYFTHLKPLISVQSCRVQMRLTIPHIGIFLLITTANNTMDLAFNYAEPLINADWIKQLAKITEEMMISACEIEVDTQKSEYLAPRNELETTIAIIWKEILKIEQIGIHDNFFELGGDSQSGVQIIAKLKEKFPEKELSCFSLLGAPTIYGLEQLLQS